MRFLKNFQPHYQAFVQLGEINLKGGERRSIIPDIQTRRAFRTFADLEAKCVCWTVDTLTWKPTRAATPQPSSRVPPSSTEIPARLSGQCVASALVWSFSESAPSLFHLSILKEGHQKPSWTTCFIHLSGFLCHVAIFYV